MEPNEHPTSGLGSETWHASLNRALLDSALDCIITMDANGRVLEFNAAAERVFGYSREQAVGQELASLIIPPALRERHRKGLRHYLETGEGPVLGQAARGRPPFAPMGRRFWSNWRSRPCA